MSRSLAPVVVWLTSRKNNTWESLSIRDYVYIYYICLTIYNYTQMYTVYQSDSIGDFNWDYFHICMRQIDLPIIFKIVLSSELATSWPFRSLRTFFTARKWNHFATHYFCESVWLLTIMLHPLFFKQSSTTRSSGLGRWVAQSPANEASFFCCCMTKVMFWRELLIKLRSLVTWYFTVPECVRRDSRKQRRFCMFLLRWLSYVGSSRPNPAYPCGGCLVGITQDTIPKKHYKTEGRDWSGWLLKQAVISFFTRSLGRWCRLA